MSIVVSPLSLAPRLAKLHKVSHVVSLLDPDTPFPVVREVGDRHLRMEIHDIETPVDGLDICCTDRMKMILDFVGGWQRSAPILIHCYAGLSRSTATAYITACAHNPSADEEEIARALREASAHASPNRHLVALADAALGRDGRMVRAIERIGRGASWYDVGENAPFTLASRFGA
jgi:predicted protein tyrosine phosphatase